MSHAANIFPSNDGKRRLPDEKLQAYLNNSLSAEEQYEVEVWLAEEGMESDALDGLQQMDPLEVQQTLNKLQRDLHRQLIGKKRKRKGLYKDNQWAMTAIFIVLLLCLLGYVLLRMLSH